MGSLESRIGRLEGRIEPPRDEGAELRRVLMVAILDEYSSLRWFGGNTHWIQKGSDDTLRSVPIPPEKQPAHYLGDSYTDGQLWELAIRRVLEREHEKAPDLLEAGDIEKLTEGWVRAFKGRFAKEGWDWNRPRDDGA
jgi:hypothetical protein